MRRKFTVSVAAATPFAIALIAAGCGTCRCDPVSTRSDPARKWRPAGHLRGPSLYRFIEDTKAGQTRGEGSQLFGAGWDVLSPAGKEIESND